ncbi:MAG TPA: GMC family oxidoreductase [Polyangiales bacterium]|jgi:choline dehydrogenase-like flavoprotein|nr:GMC family oxidoreductase [Polyangiales bacterium]
MSTTRTLDYDVIIVGSGAGGGTVAERLSPLCASGARIAVLEAGPHYTREHFDMREPNMLQLFLDRGAVPSTSFDIAVTAAQCVGGSTSVYTGVTFRAPEGLIAGWSRDFGLPELSEQDVQSRFARLEGEINAHVPGRDYENENNRVFRAGCEQLGLPVKQFKLNIESCERCGFCNLGCPYGAKRGTLEVQLPAATARGVELIPNCRVTRVYPGGADAVIHDAPAGTHASPHGTGPLQLRAKHVIVAAGTLNSSALLLRSQLPDLSPACGKYLTLHPALTSFARMRDPVRGFEGFPKLYYTDAFSESEHHYLETAFYFPFITAKSLPGFGAELKRFMRAYDHLACTIALVHDEPEEHNRIRVQGERNVLDYRLSPASREALVASQRRAGEIYFAAGAEEYVSLLGTRFSITRAADLPSAIDDSALLPGKVVVSSAHPMGGCRMGKDPQTSVTNAFGEVHGSEGVYVADASLFPTSSKVNPYLTVMALAERVAERVGTRLRAPGSA